MSELTDEQVKNWREVLCATLGPYALLMPREQVQAFRDKMQTQVNKLDKKLTEDPLTTEKE